MEYKNSTNAFTISLLCRLTNGPGAFKKLFPVYTTRHRKRESQPTSHSPMCTYYTYNIYISLGSPLENELLTPSRNTNHCSRLLSGPPALIHPSSDMHSSPSDAQTSVYKEQNFCFSKNEKILNKQKYCSNVWTTSNRIAQIWTISCRDGSVLTSFLAVCLFTKVLLFVLGITIVQLFFKRAKVAVS